MIKVSVEERERQRRWEELKRLEEEESEMHLRQMERDLQHSRSKSTTPTSSSNNSSFESEQPSFQRGSQTGGGGSGTGAAEDRLSSNAADPSTSTFTTFSSFNQQVNDSSLTNQNFQSHHESNNKFSSSPPPPSSGIGLMSEWDKLKLEDERKWEKDIFNNSASDNNAHRVQSRNQEELERRQKFMMLQKSRQHELNSSTNTSCPVSGSGDLHHYGHNINNSYDVRFMSVVKEEDEEGVNV